MATYSDDSSSIDVATDETDRLIASDKVEGTAVYNRQGERLGSIYSFMVDKFTGKVAYAVMSFGGFLGIGDDHYPLPWQSLTYNTDLGGYQVAITNDQLTNAPHYSSNDDWDWEDRTRTRGVNDYYGVPFAAY